MDYCEVLPKVAVLNKLQLHYHNRINEYYIFFNQFMAILFQRTGTACQALKLCQPQPDTKIQASSVKREQQRL